MKINLNPEYSLEVRKIIGAFFKETRQNKNLTQKELSEKMGVNQNTIGKIEKGYWNFSLDFIILFCAHLDLNFFFESKDSDNEQTEFFRSRHKRPNQEN